MKKLLTTLVLTASVISGCASVESFEEPMPIEETGSQASAQGESVQLKPSEVEQPPLAKEDISESWPTAIQPEVGTTYIRKLDAKTGNITFQGSDVPLKVAIMPLVDHENIELMDSNVDFSSTADISVNGMSPDRYLLVLERAYDVELTDHGNRMAIGSIIDGIIDSPIEAEGFESSVLHYLNSYAPDKPSLVAPLNGGRYLVTGSPNAVKRLLNANAQRAVTGQQVMVEVLLRMPTGQLSQTRFLTKTEGKSTAPIEGGSITVEVSSDADHQLTSNVLIEMEGFGTQSYEVIQQSGNRIPLVFSQEQKAFEVSYMVKLVSQLYGQ